jgi:hypothetical protein
VELDTLVSVNTYFSKTVSNKRVKFLYDEKYLESLDAFMAVMFQVEVFWVYQHDITRRHNPEDLDLELLENP